MMFDTKAQDLPSHQPITLGGNLDYFIYLEYDSHVRQGITLKSPQPLFELCMWHETSFELWLWNEKYVEISHSPPGWHVMCNKTEFMFPQNLNTFLALERNLNKKRSDTGSSQAAAARGLDLRIQNQLHFTSLCHCHLDHGQVMKCFCVDQSK